MKKIVLILFIAFTNLMFSQETGSIVGKITDKDFNNEPLPFVTIAIKDTNKGTTSDLDGLFNLDDIVVGTYSLEFSFVGYETTLIDNVIVEANKVTTVNLAMGSSAATLDEVVIKTTTRRDSEVASLLDQKKAVEIKQTIGADELSRKAASTVEQGLTKISGITNVQDRGIFVRGLDDRYNFLLINGLPLASSDPDNKIIPLNYISTNIVETINVFKTFNAALYQDFAGATFQINTKSIPINPITVISIGVEANTNTTFKDFFTDDSGASDFFGFTGNKRNLPSQFGEGQQTAFTATPAESATLFDTSWTPKNESAAPATSFGISHGQNLYRGDDSNLGFFFSLNYKNNFSTEKGVERVLNSEGTAQQDFQTSNYSFDTQKSALFTLEYQKYEKYNLTFNTIYLQNSTNSIREAEGLNDSFTQLNNIPFFIRDTKYTENDVLALQLFGDFQWNDKKHQIHFAASASQGNNEIPDRRVLRAAGSGENAEYITTNGIDPFKFFQTLENTNFNAKLEYELGLQKNEDDDRFNSNLKVGYNADFIEYDFFNRFITVNVGNSAPIPLPDLNTNDPEAFFQEGFQNGYLFYRNTLDPTATNNIKQFTNAGYLNFAKSWEKLLVEIGVRAEQLVREISFREPLSSPSSPFEVLEFDPFEISPSLNLKYNVNEYSNLRFAASKTNTRPRLREIIPTTYQDGDGNQTIGNENLINSTNYNADLKYEIFPTRSEVFTIGVFGKYIQDPIERLALTTTIGTRTFFGNFDEATLFGAEIEARINMGNIFKTEALNPFNLGFNGIIMTSNATANVNDPRFAAVTNKDRKLQGASDWGINADLSYNFLNTEKTKSTVNLIFNTFGERIYAVGVEGADEIFEKPINQLDLSWQTDFNDKIGVRINVKNILNEDTLFTQDPTQEVAFPDRFTNVIESFDVGTTIGLNISYKF
ncbi:MAG: outer membrane beta-barrel protein [Flavobacteriaceae bacterium]